jgi:hypothetical protein
VLHEAALLRMAEVMLVEVLGRVRPQDEDVVLPPAHARAGVSRTIAVATARHLQDEADVRSALTGEPEPVDPVVADAARRTCAVAAAQDDGDRVMLGDGEPTSVRALLVRATVERSLLAHYVAAYLGSPACPLPEELARPLWELTSPDAEAWRRAGWFFEPLPLPPHVSWRDRFLLTAGHPPHPLGH